MINLGIQKVDRYSPTSKCEKIEKANVWPAVLGTRRMHFYPWNKSHVFFFLSKRSKIIVHNREAYRNEDDHFNKMFNTTEKYEDLFIPLH